MYQCITLGFRSVNAWQLTENQHSLPVWLPTLVYTSQTNSDKLRLCNFSRQFVTRAAIGRQLPYHQLLDQWGTASHLPVCDRTGILQNTENFILFGIWGKSVHRKPLSKPHINHRFQVRNSIKDNQQRVISSIFTGKHRNPDLHFGLVVCCANTMAMQSVSYY